jgi:hypothetical protein
MISKLELNAIALENHDISSCNRISNNDIDYKSPEEPVVIDTFYA